MMGYDTDSAVTFFPVDHPMPGRSDAVRATFGIVALREHTTILLATPLQWLGKISYSLYIVHSPVGWVVIHFALVYVGRDVSMNLAFGMALLVAWGTYILGEQRGSRALKSLLLRFRSWLDGLRAAPRRLGGET